MEISRKKLQTVVDEAMTIQMTTMNGGSRLRSKIVKGRMLRIPVPGSFISIEAEALDPEIKAIHGVRHVQTSQVREATFLPDGNGVFIDTISGSRYHLEMIDEEAI